MRLAHPHVGNNGVVGSWGVGGPARCCFSPCGADAQGRLLDGLPLPPPLLLPARPDKEREWVWGLPANDSGPESPLATRLGHRARLQGAVTSQVVEPGARCTNQVLPLPSYLSGCRDLISLPHSYLMCQNGFITGSLSYRGLLGGLHEIGGERAVLYRAPGSSL